MTTSLYLAFYNDGKGTINLNMPAIKAQELGNLELVDWHNPEKGEAWASFRMNPAGVRGTTVPGAITHRYQFYNKKERGKQRIISGVATHEYKGDLLIVRVKEPVRRKTFKDILG